MSAHFYKDPAQEDRARQSDLVALPESVDGARCGNCRFFLSVHSQCCHPKVDLPVLAHMCCCFWDAEGTVNLFTGKGPYD